MKALSISLLFALATATVSGQNAVKKWIDVNYADDGKVCHNMDIHIPDSTGKAAKPIILIYGSAWFSNNAKQMAFMSMGKPLLESGFAVVSINHRSSSDALYPAQINDVKAAVRYIRANAKKFNLDASFIGITGFSSGGHLSSLAGTTNNVKSYTSGSKTVDIEGNIGNYTKESSRVDAVVDWFGPINLMNMDNCSKPKMGNSPEAALIGGQPSDNPDMAALAGPTIFVDAKDPRFLVIHGDADNVVPSCQSENFAKELSKFGLLEEYVVVPGGQHGPVTFNENTFRKMTDFFKKELK